MCKCISCTYSALFHSHYVKDGKVHEMCIGNPFLHENLESYACHAHSEGKVIKKLNIELISKHFTTIIVLKASAAGIWRPKKKVDRKNHAGSLIHFLYRKCIFFCFVTISSTTTIVSLFLLYNFILK